MSSEKKKTDKLICGAKTRSGEPCQNYPMDNGRCRMHGGRNVEDKRNEIASTRRPPGRPPSHGRYSKYLKETLKEKYEEFENDPDILSLKSELAQMRALLARYLEDISGEDKCKDSDLGNTNMLVSEIRKLAHTINGIELSRKLALTPEEIKRILGAIADVISTEITDKKLKERVIKKISNIKVM